MRFLAIIPARKGSKGIKNKNFKLFNGKPLVYWTIKSAKKSKYLNKILVSTDSSIIKNFSLKMKIYCPFLRPKNLSTDKTTANKVIVHALNFLKQENNYVPDAVVYLQPTSPLREAKDIDNACKIFNYIRPDSLVSVVKIHHNLNPSRVYSKSKKNFLKKISRKKEKIALRQNTKSYYGNNGASIYITSIKKINEFITGGKLIGYEMSKLKSIDIDEIDDFKLAEVIQKKFKFNLR